MNGDMSTVTILGGHGKVALLCIPQLIDRGHTVTAVIRKQEQVEEVESLGATAKVLDLSSASEEDLTEALAGQDVIVWSAGAGGGDDARTWTVDRDAAIRSMDAAERASVPRYVMVSYFGAGFDHGVPEDHSFYSYAQSKAIADDHLKKSGLNWTILGPSTLTLEEDTGIDVAATEATQVSRASVAAVIVEAIENDSTIGRVIKFNQGETPVSQAVQQAAQQ